MQQRKPIGQQDNAERAKRQPNKDLKVSQDTMDIGSDEMPQPDFSEIRYTQEELERERKKKALLQSQKKKLRAVQRPSINTY